MRITVLVENTSCGPVDAAHGLSLYVETAGHRILFDAGPDGGLLLRNAAALGVDLGAADAAILSHGHYDHAGGLLAFLEVNGRAPLYLQRGATAPHGARENTGLRGIGMDPQIEARYPERLVRLDGDFRIDEELSLFSDVRTADFLSGSNRALLERCGRDWAPDRFLHEQNLLIEEGGKLVLIAGCAHRGILNILRSAKERAGRAPDAVYAGFHLTNPGRGIDEPELFIRALGAELQRWPCRFYTGHCTGAGPFGILSEMLGDRLRYLAGGDVFEE